MSVPNRGEYCQSPLYQPKTQRDGGISVHLAYCGNQLSSPHVKQQQIFYTEMILTQCPQSSLLRNDFFWYDACGQISCLVKVTLAFSAVCRFPSCGLIWLNISEGMC